MYSFIRIEGRRTEQDVPVGLAEFELCMKDVDFRPGRGRLCCFTVASPAILWVWVAKCVVASEVEVISFETFKPEGSIEGQRGQLDSHTILLFRSMDCGSPCFFVRGI